MPGPSDLTLSLGGHKRETADRPMPQPTLFVALECDRPAAGSSRHALGGVSVVLLGRGRTCQHERTSGAAGEELVVRVPDPWMSSQHARLEASFGRWILSDAGSKNGTLVNGAAIDRSVLHDGDLVELGHSLFWFRERVPLGHDDPRDLVIELAEAAVRQPGMVTLAAAYRRTLDDLERMAPSGIGILLLGESGTGKELLARALHHLSGRSGDLVAVNCGAIPDTLVESELFGHKKGAFSGAAEDRVGLVRSAHGGTLFLDEVGDLPLGSQAALLRVLQEKEVMPVGASRPVPVDTRVVAATHRDLDDMVERGEFRQDLFARLAGFTAELPPLRDRREDLGLLFGSLLARHVGEVGEHPGIDPVAARALYRYPWPRNVRELDSALATALVLAAGKTLTLEHLPGEIRAALDARPAQPPPAPVSPAATSGGGEIGLSAEDRALRDELVSHLRHHAGNVSAVARAMGKDRKQIQRWVKRFGLTPESFR